MTETILFHFSQYCFFGFRSIGKFTASLKVAEKVLMALKTKSPDS